MTTTTNTPSASAILRYDDVQELHDELVDELQSVIGDAKLSRRQLLRATAHQLPDAIRKEMAERVGPAYAKMLPRFADVKAWMIRAANTVYHCSRVEIVAPIEPGQPVRYRYIVSARAFL